MRIGTPGTGVKWLNLTGGLLLLLGIVHLAAAPGTLRGVPEGVPEEFRAAFLFFFAAAGAGVILCGLLVLWASYGLARQWRGSWTLGLMAGLFALLLGAGAVAAMPRNLFAYALLALGLGVLPALLRPLRGRPGSGEVVDFRREEPRDPRRLH